MKQELKKIYFDEYRKGLKCPYCDSETTVFPKNAVIKHGSSVNVRGCLKCGAFVSLNGMGQPLGSVAKYELRSIRAKILTLVNQCYSLMEEPDLKKKQKIMSTWMSNELGLLFPSILVSQLDYEDCSKLIKCLELKIRDYNSGSGQLTFNFKNVENEK